MPDTRQVIVAKKLEQLTLWEKDGMLVVSGMGMEGLKHQGEGGPPLCKVQVPLEEAGGSKDGATASKPSCHCPDFHTCRTGPVWPSHSQKDGGSQFYQEMQGTFKVWGLLILCLNTKAVKVYVAVGYSTADFMMLFEQSPRITGGPLQSTLIGGASWSAAPRRWTVPTRTSE